MPAVSTSVVETKPASPMTDKSSQDTDEDEEGLEAAEEEIEEEPGSGMGPASDMDRADDAENEKDGDE